MPSEFNNRREKNIDIDKFPKLTFYSDDLDHTFILEGKDLFVYDEDNNLVGTATFGPDGELVMDEGYAYENRSYNEWGDLTEIVYVGIDGKPVVADCGFSKWKGYYDESGRIVKQEYYDDKGTIIRTQETNKEVENSHE